MADIRKIWITKTSRYNEKTREIEYYYDCDLQVEGTNGVSIKLNLNDDVLTAIYNVISPELRKALEINLESLSNEV